VASSCEDGHESSGSINGGVFFLLVEWLLASQEGLCSIHSSEYRCSKPVFKHGS
jgi:hypothetical protein